mgnify:CR=1 FL=1
MAGHVCACAGRQECRLSEVRASETQSVPAVYMHCRHVGKDGGVHDCGTSVCELASRCGDYI